MHLSDSADWSQVRGHFREHVRLLFDVEDSGGTELFFLLQSVAHLSRLLGARQADGTELSGPRWRLLLQLLIEEHRGNPAGLTPTALSRWQRVGRNTVSALLRGLETQGLIERNLDSADLRTFRIRLTQAGRDYLRGDAPARMQALNRVLSGLDGQEQVQLAGLLDKLQRSLLAQCDPAWDAANSQEAGAAPASLAREHTNR